MAEPRDNDEEFEPDAPEQSIPEPGRRRRFALLSLRLGAGAVGLVAAAATVGAVGLAPFPTIGVTPPSVTVTPVPADQLRTCAGAAMRLGDETGANADTPAAVGVPAVRADSLNTSLERSAIATSDAGNGGDSSAPTVLRIASGDGVLVAGAQSQSVDVKDFRGYAAAACAEPSGSIWLAGGATTVGRTTILTISNPTAVTALVGIQIFGEQGEVEAPGMTGIEIQPGSQTVLSLAGFAPGVLSPVVHVEARGGQVVAYLQQSIVRGLDAVGLDIVDAAPDPATELTFPGVQIFDSVSTNRALSLDDWDDVAPAVRILNPGTEPTEVTVSVTPIDPDLVGTSFPVQAEPGMVTEVALDSGAEVDSGVALADGAYTVTMSSTQPVVAGVRVSAAGDIGAIETAGIIPSPPSDFAWYAAAPQLTGNTLVTIAPGPSPVVVAVNPTSADVSLVLDARRGDDITVVVPAGGAASTPVIEGETYVLTDAAGLFASVSYAADDAMASYPVTASRPVSGSIVIRP
ncbi:hypothetical protein BH09ACT4_BH09ACT4_01280 [soil metagenome]